MKIYLVIFFLTFIFYNTTAQKKSDPIYYKSVGIEGVIFPAQKVYELIKISYKRFTPDQKDIQLAEKILASQIEYLNKKYNKSGHNSIVIYNKLKFYKRQYFGYIDKGEKIIILNFLKSNMLRSNSWKKNIIVTEDGGEDFWNVKTNLSKKNLFELRIHPGNS